MLKPFWLKPFRLEALPLRSPAPQVLTPQAPVAPFGRSHSRVGLKLLVDIKFVISVVYLRSAGFLITSCAQLDSLSCAQLLITYLCHLLLCGLVLVQCQLVPCRHPRSVVNGLVELLLGLPNYTL